MKSFIKQLLFDTELVTKIKQVKPSEGVLYQNLISGRITMREYLAAL